MIIFKQRPYIIIILILLVTIIIFLYVRGNNDRIVILHDHRLYYSDTYRISSKSDLHTIDKIINNMNTTQLIDSNNSLRTGGFVLIEEHVGDTIITYRIKGDDVTKYVYKENFNNLLSTTYFKLDDKYYQLLKDVCDKQRKKNL